MPPSRPRRSRHCRRGHLPRRLLQQASEAPLEHFAQHSEIVPRRELGGADIELAILVLLKALGTGHDHGADRIGALNMAVVENLDAQRRRRKLQPLPQGFEQLAL